MQEALTGVEMLFNWSEEEEAAWCSYTWRLVSSLCPTMKRGRFLRLDTSTTSENEKILKHLSSFYIILLVFRTDDHRDIFCSAGPGYGRCKVLKARPLMLHSGWC